MRDKLGRFVKGHKHSKEAKLKMRQRRLENPSFYWLGKKRPEVGEIIRKRLEGIKLTEDHKKKISKTVIKKELWRYMNTDEAKKNSRLAKKKLWENPIYRKKQIKLLMKRRLCKRPTKPERILIDLIKRNNLPFSYVGNGKIIIEGFNPDFINNNGLKQIIEVNGDYWHNLPKVIKRDERKIGVYKKYGYKTLTIWEDELKKNFNENKIVERIKVISKEK
jgi:G:T-mismatch repair DNA endonuclease (very short patch repair protein)